MANEKISGMTAAATLDGTELVEVVQGGDNVRTTTQAIADLGSGGGGISGVAPVGNVAKVGTVASGDVVLTLVESDIDDGATQGFWTKSGSSTRQIDLGVADTSTDCSSSIGITTASGVAVGAFLFGATASFLLVENNSTELVVRDISSGAVDLVSLKLDSLAGSTLILKGTTYNSDGLLSVDLSNGLIKLGDIGNIFAQIYIDVPSKEMFHKINNIDVIQLGEGSVIVGETSVGAYLTIDTPNQIVAIGDHSGVGNGTEVYTNDLNETVNINCVKLKVNGQEGLTDIVAVGSLTFTIQNGLIISIA